MGVRLKRYPEYGVTLLMFSGAFNADEMIGQFQALDNRDRGIWLGYYDATANPSSVDLAHLPELKRTIVAKEKELFDDVKRRNAVVCCSAFTKQFFRFWSDYAGTGDEHPVTPPVFSDFRTACDWLGLPEEARVSFEVEAGCPELVGARGPPQARTAP